MFRAYLCRLGNTGISSMLCYLARVYNNKGQITTYCKNRREDKLVFNAEYGDLNLFLNKILIENTIIYHGSTISFVYILNFRFFNHHEYFIVFFQLLK